jgi:uncharacterized protein
MIEKVEKRMKELLLGEKTGHDYSHALRVFNLAMRIAEKEGGDREMIGVASLVHDAYRPYETKNEPHNGDYATRFFIKPRVLEYVSYPNEKIPHILEIVKYHEDHPFGVDGNRMKCLEGLIVQDADNLEAIGATGILRWLYFNGARGCAIGDPRKIVEAGAYDPNHLNDNAMQHLPDKILRLKRGMNTEEGKRIAGPRHDYVVGFVEQLIAEWEGKL